MSCYASSSSANRFSFFRLFCSFFRAACFFALATREASTIVSASAYRRVSASASTVAASAARTARTARFFALASLRICLHSGLCRSHALPWHTARQYMTT